jgi:uncharacterized membrane protein
MPSKALWIGGYTLPWDARCSGIYIGFGISATYHLVSNRRTSTLPPAFVILFTAVILTALPLDVLTALLGLREPSNYIRFVTGLLFGAALCVFLYPAFIVLIRKNNEALSALPTVQKALFHYLIVALAALIVKWDNLLSYGVLLTLSIFGFLSLAVILMVGLWKAIGKVFKKPAIE